MDGTRLEHTTIRGTPILLAIVVGASTAFMAAALIGRTAAIPMPGAYFAWALDPALRDIALFAWGVAVVAGPALGLPALVALALLVLAFPERGVGVVVAFLCAILASIHVFIPLVYGEEVLLFGGRPWWSFGNEVSLALAVATLMTSGGARRLRNRIR
jgi:hypothetical protein